MTRRHIPEEQRHQPYRCESLKTRKLGFISADRAVYLSEANIIAAQTSLVQPYCDKPAEYDSDVHEESMHHGGRKN